MQLSIDLKHKSVTIILAIIYNEISETYDQE